MLAEHLPTLPTHRGRRACAKRFGLERRRGADASAEIGDQYHLSRERIRQIQNSALDKPEEETLEREHRGTVEM